MVDLGGGELDGEEDLDSGETGGDVDLLAKDLGRRGRRRGSEAAAAGGDDGVKPLSREPRQSRRGEEVRARV